MQLVLLDVHFVIHVFLVFFCEPFSNNNKKELVVFLF